MPRKRNIHVVPDGEGGWNVKPEGQAPISNHSTQQDAIGIGRNQARQVGVEFFIHGRDGQIRDRDSYGNDPFPPRDRRH